MSWSRPRKLTQTYLIQMNHEAFIEKIAEIIAQAIDSETYIENEELIVEEVEWDGTTFLGHYSCECKAWYSPQTMYEPEEFELEREYISDNKGNKWIKNLIVSHAEELVSLLEFNLEEDEDAASIEGEYDD